MILYQATLNTFRSATVSDELADYNDDNILYTTQFIPSKALKKFGFFGFYFMNVSNTLNSLLGGGQTDGRQSLLALDNYFSQGEMSESTLRGQPLHGRAERKKYRIDSSSSRGSGTALIRNTPPRFTPWPTAEFLSPNITRGIRPTFRRRCPFSAVIPKTAIPPRN